MPTETLDWLISSKGGLVNAIRQFDRRLPLDQWGSDIRLEAYERGISPRMVAIQRRNELVARLSRVKEKIAEISIP